MLGAVFTGGCGQIGSAPAQTQTQGSDVERGKYLVAALDCHACHTPHDQTGQPIAGRELTGHPAGAVLPQWEPSMLEKGILATMNPTLTAYAGPFGVSVAPNLTPDPETGIGNLTAEGLIASWREGTHWQTGQPIKPPMPWQSYGQLTDEDIRAIHAYLMSLEPKKPGPLAG
jgi:mono/diheme cytochrome c family protein